MKSTQYDTTALDSGLLVCQEQHRQLPGWNSRSHSALDLFDAEILNEILGAMSMASEGDSLRAVLVQDHVLRARKLLSERGYEVEVLC